MSEFKTVPERQKDAPRLRTVERKTAWPALKTGRQSLAGIKDGKTEPGRLKKDKESLAGLRKTREPGWH